MNGSSSQAKVHEKRKRSMYIDINGLLVEQISAVFLPNRSNCDTSMTFGRNVPFGSLCKKKVLATWIFNMAAIFFKDGRQSMEKTVSHRNRQRCRIYFILVSIYRFMTLLELMLECIGRFHEPINQF